MVARNTFLLLLLPGLLLIAPACSSGEDSQQAAPTATSRQAVPPSIQPSGPQVALEPDSGPPGTEVTVSGSNWEPGTQIELLGERGAGEAAQALETITTDAQGAFTVRFRIETDADGNVLPPGRLDIVARSVEQQIRSPFLVETRRPLTGPGASG